LLSLASGIAVKEAIFYMVAIALAYSLMRGLKASVFTDIIQFLMIIVFGFVLVPWAVFVAGGTHSITGGLAGVSGEFGNMFDRSVAYAMGIPITISLLAGPLADQMFYQRAMAVQKDKIRAVFIRGGLLFGIVPILLSLLGFVGVTLSQTQGLIVGDPQMVAPLVIDMLLPKIGLYMFILMAFAGLCSTMDSAFCAVSSLGAVDVYKRYLNKRASHKKMLKIARDFMVVAAVIGGGIAMLEPKLLWVFFIYGALAGAGFVATIMAVFFKWVGARSLDIAIVLSLVTSLPLSIYANIQENTDLIVLSALSSIIVSFIVFAISGLCHKKL
jgi:Na+/proline symporter